MGTSAYARWLRAWRPPLQWFIQQSEEGQEALAAVGDRYAGDLIVDLGYATQDPKLAEDGVTQDTDGADETKAQRLANAVVARIKAQRGQANGPSLPKLPPDPFPSSQPLTMVGSEQRRAESDLRRREAGPRLFGRKPDEPKKPAEPENMRMTEGTGPA